MGNQRFQARYEPRVQSRSCKERNKADTGMLWKFLSIATICFHDRF